MPAGVPRTSKSTAKAWRSIVATRGWVPDELRALPSIFVAEPARFSFSLRCRRSLSRERLVSSRKHNEFRWIDLLPALLVAGWNIASAPFLNSELMGQIRRSLGVERFIFVFAAVSAVFGVAVLVAGWFHLRQNRGRRLAWIAGGLALVVAYALVSDRGAPREEVIERLHFVTYGTLAALLVVPWRRLGRWMPLGTIAGCLVVSLADESMQWLVPVRVGEFFDLWLNVYCSICGTLVGIGLFSNGGFVRGPLRIGWRPESSAVVAPRSTGGARRALAVAIALAVLGTAAFIDVAHLGYRIVNDDLEFRSFFDEDELRARNARAAERWKASPPGKLTPWEREDWFRTEAGWHTSARNRAWSREDWAAAALENRILERYYGAFLDLREGELTRRYPPVQVTQLEKWAEGLIPAGSQSQATERIWLRPTRLELWGAALVIALGFAFVLGRARREPTDT